MRYLILAIFALVATSANAQSWVNRYEEFRNQISRGECAVEAQLWEREQALSLVRANETRELIRVRWNRANAVNPNGITTAYWGTKCQVKALRNFIELTSQTPEGVVQDAAYLIPVSSIQDVSAAHVISCMASVRDVALDKLAMVSLRMRDDANINNNEQEERTQRYRADQLCRYTYEVYSRGQKTDFLQFAQILKSRP